MNPAIRPKTIHAIIPITMLRKKTASFPPNIRRVCRMLASLRLLPPDWLIRAFLPVFLIAQDNKKTQRARLCPLGPSACPLSSRFISTA